MPPKGVSLEEKRTRMLSIFTESSEVFQLKDIERIAPKEKGIIAQAVKDVLQSLVDDGLVTQDKIGTSNYFWALPSQITSKRKARFVELSDKLSVLKSQKVFLESQIRSIDEATSGANDKEEREREMEKSSKLKEENAKLEAEFSGFSDCDPDKLEEMKRDAALVKTAANRWTDNVFTLISWCANKSNADAAELRRNFNIPEDFDYVN